MKILVFGDSIAYGKRDPEGGWVARLRTWIDETYNLGDSCSNAQVYNCSIPGETALRLQQRLQQELNMRIVDPDPQMKKIVIFAVGINDSCVSPWIQDAQTPIDLFENAVNSMVVRTASLGCEMLLVGLTPVDEKKKWGKRNNKEIQRYDAVLQKIAGENALTYIPLFSLFQEGSFVSSMNDGIHPDAGGHQLIFDQVKNCLENMATSL